MSAAGVFAAHNRAVGVPANTLNTTPDDYPQPVVPSGGSNPVVLPSEPPPVVRPACVHEDSFIVVEALRALTRVRQPQVVGISPEERFKGPCNNPVDYIAQKRGYTLREHNWGHSA